MSMAPPQGSSPLQQHQQQQQQQQQVVVAPSHGYTYNAYHHHPPHHLKPTAVLAGKPTLIQWGKLRFLIMDAPRDSNLVQYIREARAHCVTDIVRVCEPSYSAKEVEAAGIRLHEMSYEDGASPPPEVIDRWLALVEEVFYKQPAAAASSSMGGLTSRRSSTSSTSSVHSAASGAAATDPAQAPSSSQPSPQQQPQPQPQQPCSTIAVHCVAGLGRAPVLVALALIEHGFGDPSAVVEFIRSQRRGAINMRQLNYLEAYQKRSGGQCGVCAIM